MQEQVNNDCAEKAPARREKMCGRKNTEILWCLAAGGAACAVPMGRLLPQFTFAATLKAPADGPRASFPPLLVRVVFL